MHSRDKASFLSVECEIKIKERCTNAQVLIIARIYELLISGHIRFSKIRINKPC